MTEPIVSWPPTHEQRAHLAQLAKLIRQFGAERFTTAPLVRADERDFPDTWEPTLTAVQRVLYRLCWHAHWDAEIVVNDVRPAAPPDERMLIPSEIELASAENGVITVDVAAIGNDDVAGLLSHRVGQAFLELAPGDPFRAGGSDISETAGSITAIYLGLGVLVANSAMYRRYASRIIARVVVEEQYVAGVGGLTIDDATFLIAVQDLVRDDYQPALTTLLKPQAEWVERWRALLDSHESALRAMLELDEVEPRPLERRAAPRVPAEQTERDLRRFNLGKTTFRVPARGYWRPALGFALGILGFAAPYGVYVGPAAMLVLTVVGLLLTRKHFLCADPMCSWNMPTEVATCPGCGGSIAETIAHANLRLDRLEELGRDRSHDHEEHA